VIIKYKDIIIGFVFVFCLFCSLELFCPKDRKFIPKGSVWVACGDGVLYNCKNYDAGDVIDCFEIDDEMGLTKGCLIQLPLNDYSGRVAEKCEEIAYVKRVCFLSVESFVEYWFSPEKAAETQCFISQFI
jgi:hypothetical protein